LRDTRYNLNSANHTYTPKHICNGIMSYTHQHKAQGIDQDLRQPWISMKQPTEAPRSSSASVVNFQ